MLIGEERAKVVLPSFGSVTDALRVLKEKESEERSLLLSGLMFTSTFQSASSSRSFSCISRRLLLCEISAFFTV